MRSVALEKYLVAFIKSILTEFSITFRNDRKKSLHFTQKVKQFDTFIESIHNN